MNFPKLSIGTLERRLSNGTSESITFKSGVNLIVGRPNTGKTKWLQTLDYLLGDPGDNPFAGEDTQGLTDKYNSVAGELFISGDRFWVERRWTEPRSKTKVFVNGDGMTTTEFQHLLFNKLDIPLLNYPKGNPLSGQTWPELSFRTLLRHIHRQQRFWSGLVDQQPDSEQHASIMLFLGIADRLFSEEYGQLVDLKREVERLKARREQYGQTLDELTREVLSEPGLTQGANPTTIKNTAKRISADINKLLSERESLVSNTVKNELASELQSRVLQFGEERANIIVSLDLLNSKVRGAVERLDDIRSYRDELNDELDRIMRAETAGGVLSDLKITHCPACDQSVANLGSDSEHCFLCSQPLPGDPIIDGQGATRLEFEKDRLKGEVREAEDLYKILEEDIEKFEKEIASAKERLTYLEDVLAPTKQKISALVQEEISAIDMDLGEMYERQRQLNRISKAVVLGQELTQQINETEREIEPLSSRVEELERSTDFEAAIEPLQEGINAYFDAINEYREGVWRHSDVNLHVSRSGFSLRIGSRRWQSVLGGTDSLYFLIAYHYGLLTLSNRPGCHYPGLSVIDVPGELSGEAVADKENFIVQPFIELLSEDSYADAQLIISGASFEGLDGVNRIALNHVYVAS